MPLDRIFELWSRMFQKKDGERTDWRQSLAEHLEERIPSPLHVFKFEWGRTNSVRGRNCAAVKLRDHIARIAQKHRAAKHYLIGHSHGGSVAMYALRDASARGAVDGVICLATPFLVGKFRDLSEYGLALALAVVVVLQ